MKKVSVPGNLLLLGEYAVLEPGGLGAALALQKRIVLTVNPAEELLITGVFGETSVEWSKDKTCESPLISSVVESCDSWLRSREPIEDLLQVHIHIDSSAFFLSSGRKSGHGSSAAVSVGLTAVLLDLAGFPDEELENATLHVALQAHRKAQKATGSGYDIATSLFGGVGLFMNAPTPRWTPYILPWLPPLFLFRGEKSISTPDAIERYRIWNRENPKKAKDFLKRSNQNVIGFIGSSSWSEAEPYFRRSGDLSLQLGEMIGIDARIVPPRPLNPQMYKALGAGNEVGVYVSSSHETNLNGFDELSISGRGVMWNP